MTRSSNGGRYRSDIKRMEIYWVDWSPGRGSEQTGVRPAVVIQADAGNANPRYGQTVVATISTSGSTKIPTHAEIEPSVTNGLRSKSFVKAEQILTISKDRLGAMIGSLSNDETSHVDAALKRAQGLR